MVYMHLMDSIYVSRSYKYKSYWDVLCPNLAKKLFLCAMPVTLKMIEEKTLWDPLSLISDLSAALNTISHHVLLQRLELWIQDAAGCLCKSLWIRTSAKYKTSNWLVLTGGHITGLGDISNIAKIVNVNDNSPCQRYKYGIPYGSLLGPRLFSLCMLPLGAAIRKHNIYFHCYAGNHAKLYMCLKSDRTTADKPKLWFRGRKVWITQPLAREILGPEHLIIASILF